MYLYRRAVHHIRHLGMASFLRACRRNLMDAVYPRRAPIYRMIEPYVRGKRGFEVGGPSRTFSRTGLLPLYRVAARVDNCNFGPNTIWEGAVAEGAHFRYGSGRVLGQQYVREATDLWGIPSETYDFVCSAFALQHSANPIRALVEMVRLLRVDGILVLLLPHKDRTFDRKRPVTAMQHLVDDFNRGTGEDDRTHLDEVLALHDLSLDPLAGTYAEFKARTLQNSTNRAVHHHVFDTRLGIQALDYVGLQVVGVELLTIDNLILIGRKLPSGAVRDNADVLAKASSLEFDCDDPRGPSLAVPVS